MQILKGIAGPDGRDSVLGVRKAFLEPITSPTLWAKLTLGVSTVAP